MISRVFKLSLEYLIEIAGHSQYSATSRQLLVQRIPLSHPPYFPPPPPEPYSATSETQSSRSSPKTPTLPSTTYHSKKGGHIHRQASLNRLSIPAAHSLQNQADGPTPSNPSFPSFANSSNPVTPLPSPFSSFSSVVGETNPRSRTATPFPSLCTSLNARSRPVHIIRASSIPPVRV